jgi:hypothetical protein
MMDKQVSLFVTKSIKFMVCLVLLDAGLGEMHRYVFSKQGSGRYYRLNYTMDVSTEELVVFGSSHAAQHYVPEVLRGELGLTAYNAGDIGQGILIHEALQKIMLQRTTPKVMILDIDRFGFYQDSYDYGKLSELNPFYHKHPEIIGGALALRSKLTKYFLKSKLYQYNSTIAHILRYWLAPQRDDNGYIAIFRELPKPATSVQRLPETAKTTLTRTRPLDENAVAALEKFILNAKRRNVRLVLVFSPTFEYTTLEADDAVKKVLSIANENGIRLMSFVNDPGFLGHYELFADNSFDGHLNDTGARLFSKRIAEKIKEEFPGLSRN